MLRGDDGARWCAREVERISGVVLAEMKGVCGKEIVDESGKNQKG